MSVVLFLTVGRIGWSNWTRDPALEIGLVHGPKVPGSLAEGQNIRSDFIRRIDYSAIVISVQECLVELLFRWSQLNRG